MAYDDYYTSTQQYNSSSGSAFSFLDSDPPIIDTTSIASGHHVPQSHQDLFSEPVTFQMPAFMQETNTVPSLASGGGALFYPFGPPPTTGKDWMPYSVYQDEPSCKTAAAAAPVIHTQIYDPASAQQQTGVVAFDNPGAAPFEYEPIPAPLPTNPARDTHLDSFLSNSGALMQTQASNEGQQSQQGFDEAPLEQPQQPHPQLELVEGSQMGDGVVHPTPAAAQNSVHHHPNNALQALPNHEHGIPSLAPPPPPPPPPLPLAPPSSLVSTSFSTAQQVQQAQEYSGSQHGQHSTTRQLQHGHGHGNGGGSGSGQGHGLGHGHYQQQQQQHHSQMMHQQQHQHQQRVGVGMKRPWGAVDR